MHSISLKLLLHHLRYIDVDPYILPPTERVVIPPPLRVPRPLAEVRVLQSVYCVHTVGLTQPSSHVGS